MAQHSRSLKRKKKKKGKKKKKKNKRGPNQNPNQNLKNRGLSIPKNGKTRCADRLPKDHNTLKSLILQFLLLKSLQQ
jgi:hypothetical protein